MQSHGKCQGFWCLFGYQQQQNQFTNTTATECRQQAHCASVPGFVSVDFGKLLCAFHNPVVQILCFQPMSVPSFFCSIYSSDEDDEDIEMCDHDYDGLLPKSGKRHLGKTRWTREEVTSRFNQEPVMGENRNCSSVACACVKTLGVFPLPCRTEGSPHPQLCQYVPSATCFWIICCSLCIPSFPFVLCLLISHSGASPLYPFSLYLNKSFVL